MTVLNLVRFSRLWINFPSNLSIAEVPVGQLSRQAAAERLLTVYSQPIELNYNESTIHLDPASVGFTLDTDAMLAAAEQERTRISFWEAYWNYLWDRPIQPVDVPLRATYSEERIRVFLLDEIATRYDQLPTAAIPVVGTTNFKAGSAGSELDIERALPLIEASLFTLNQRSVTLPIKKTTPTHPTFQNLDVLLRQTIDLAGFDGVIGVYVGDLQTGQALSFILDKGSLVASPPDVAFTASSTIKIPIMISVFRRIGDSLDAETTKNLEDMIAKSINTASDWLMQNKIDRERGPLVVTEDMQTLGMVNTFLGGYFYAGAPLLQVFKTPANQRADITTEPDPYSQTTPTEMGQLLMDLYQCANMDGGALIAAFPGEITSAECQSMINYLIQDRIALLIQAGVPDGTNVAHKHGWVTDAYGIIHDMSDAAIVFTPGGNFVFTIYMYHPVQIVFDPANQLVKDLSRAIYNFYNIPTP
ncbi:MAG TPA: serine hydrolase [Anaerolineales bacterium]|nr:serine hydrolase [Anaerolineales bacterium]